MYWTPHEALEGSLLPPQLKKEGEQGAPNPLLHLQWSSIPLLPKSWKSLSWSTKEGKWEIIALHMNFIPWCIYFLWFHVIAYIKASFVESMNQLMKEWMNDMKVSLRVFSSFCCEQSTSVREQAWGLPPLLLEHRASERESTYPSSSFFPFPFFPLSKPKSCPEKNPSRALLLSGALKPSATLEFFSFPWSFMFWLCFLKVPLFDCWS